MEIGHDIKCAAILSLPLISRAAVSYLRQDVHLVPVNCLGSLNRNSAVRLTDRLDMTIAVDWDENHNSNKQNP